MSRVLCTMLKRLFCGILAALILSSAISSLAACTGGGDTGTDTPSLTFPVSETDPSPAESAPDGTEEATEDMTVAPETEEEDTAPETEPPVQIQVPAYEDIGLAEYLSGQDDRLELVYDFTDPSATLSDLRLDNALRFTSDGTLTKDDFGITVQRDAWNALGFTQVLTEPYTAEATLYNHGTSDSATSSVMCGVRVKSPEHLFIDSGLWVTVNNGNAYLVVHQVLTVSLGTGLPFDAGDGVVVGFADSGTEIQITVGGQPLATVTVDEDAETFTVLSADGSELGSGSLDRLAHRTTLGYVRTMQHFAHASVASLRLTTGSVRPYAPADTVTELRNGFSYFLSEKVQYTCASPITLLDGAAFLDASAVARLLGFSYNGTDDTVTLTRDTATLTFPVNQATVTLNGVAHAFPTVVRRDGAVLIAADYIARWMGYSVRYVGDAIYIVGDDSILTEEKLQEMNDRYQLYQDVIYNYDDVEADQTGVGLYDPTPYEDRLVGIAYTTWHSPTFTSWGSGTWDLPLQGPYSSDDREVIYNHGILLRDAGIDFVFVDWSNNTCYDPATMREQRADFRMIEEATDVLFEVWSQIEGAPKICIFAGPGHSGPENVANGNHQRKVDQIWTDYVEKYPDLYFRYEGKPLLMCYGATPNLYGSRPSWNDDRFTVRWMTGYVGQQGSLFNAKTLKSHGFWSWEERGAQTFTVTKDKRVECITCTAASRAQGQEGEAGYIPAYGRDNGMTLKKQFQRANDLGAGMVILVSWNEWTTGEQPSAEVSKDLEPSQIHGTFYYDLLCQQIKKFKGQLTVSPKD